MGSRRNNSTLGAGNQLAAVVFFNFNIIVEKYRQYLEKTPNAIFWLKIQVDRLLYLNACLAKILEV